MPWGLKRYHESGQTHFVTFSCYRRRPLLMATPPKRSFELALERVRRSFGLCVYGYVVMLFEPRVSGGTHERPILVPR